MNINGTLSQHTNVLRFHRGKTLCAVGIKETLDKEAYRAMRVKL